MRQRQTQLHRSRQRRGSSSFLLRFFVGIAAVIILTLCFSTFLRQQDEFETLSKEQRQLEKERDELADTYEALRDLNDIADSDAYVEYVARQQLDMIRPGEYVIIEK